MSSASIINPDARLAHRSSAARIAASARPVALLRVVLGAYILVSLAFLIGNVVTLRAEWFQSAKSITWPFTVGPDGVTVNAVSPEAMASGLTSGSVIVAISGEPYSGLSQTLEQFNSAYPGDALSVEARLPGGAQRSLRILLKSNATPSPSSAEWLSTLILAGVFPFFCLLVGYIVVAKQPADLNAWLILLQLTLPEVFFIGRWWPGAWLGFTELLSGIVWILAPATLLLFAVFFPERWKIDRKLPWLKWLVIALLLGSGTFDLWLRYCRDFRVDSIQNLASIAPWVARSQQLGIGLCLLLFGIALADRLRSGVTGSKGQRLRLLSAGSVVGLVSLLVFSLLTRIPAVSALRSAWVALFALVAFSVYPLTLAYVSLARRPLNALALMRIGARGLLSPSGLQAVRLVLVVALVLALVNVWNQPSSGQVAIVKILLLLAVLVLSYTGLSNRLSERIDVEFFGEARRSDAMLADLVEETRDYVEAAPLLETVVQRIAEALHVSQVAVFLQGKEGFDLRYAVGFPGAPSLMFPAKSLAIKHLVRTRQPVEISRERPDGWMLLADDNEMRTLDTAHAELLLPLSGKSRLMGMISLGPKTSELPYSPLDIHSLHSVATQTGLALEISSLAASLAREEAQRERVQREMEIAREVQERLFPQSLPELRGASLAGACRPAQQVGGDYYDFTQMEDGNLCLAVGDVSGKGISAALLMAALRSALRGLMLDGHNNLAELMQKINHLIYESSSSSRYATFFLAIYSPQSGSLRYCNAGHNPPVFLRLNQNDSLALSRLEDGGPVIGLLPGAIYSEQSLALHPGDMLVAYTDGLSEAMTNSNEEWGEERLIAAAQGVFAKTASEAAAAIWAAADEFTAGAPQHDDMTLLILKLADAPASPV